MNNGKPNISAILEGNDSSIFMLEDEEPFFAFGRTKLWFSVKSEKPELDMSAKELVDILKSIGEWQLDNQQDKDFFQNLNDGRTSHLIITFSRYEGKPFAPYYETGFFDGEGFRGLHGYRIYPPPTHWVAFPKPPIED